MWKYKGNEIKNVKDFGENVFGFVYLVKHNPTGKKYIGKKILFNNRKKKLTLKEKKVWREKTGGRGRPPLTKKVLAESDWKKYYGSNKFIKEIIKDGRQNEFVREVLELGFSKKHLTYLELKHQIINEVLTNEEYLNDNILGKFYRRDLETYD